MRSLRQTLKSLKKKILGLKNTMNEMKIAIRSINSRMDQARQRICELGDREFYITWSEQRKKSEESLHDLWDTIRRNNL